MQKISEFLVKKRYMLLALMLAAAAVCAVMMSKVNVITDMSEFLPDDSKMKAGVSIMSEEFDDLSSSSVIRVMSTGMSDEDKQKLFDELSALEYVSSVSYEADSPEYNKDDHSVFVMTSDYGFGSEEMNKLEEKISKDICEKYNLEYDTNDATPDGMPFYLLAFALALLFVILIVMSRSWFEPVIFVLTIGIAVVLNVGTNALLNGVSKTTNSIASILQLVLSMDYSIILINRYRQERLREDNNVQAMIKAVRGAGASVMSSALTTVVGLLALVFMSFKIGADMGIVLAKGVFISMICIFTVLPSLILLFDKVISKTEKKVPSFRMNRIAAFSAKFRYAFPCLLIVFFAATIILKGNTLITYSNPQSSEVEKIFPEANSIVVVYDNSDEKAISIIAADLERESRVKSVSAYCTTIGRQYTSEQLAAALTEMSGDIKLEPWMLDLIYYKYSGGEASPLSMKEFLSSVSNLALIDPDLLAKADLSMMKQLNGMNLFADKDEIMKQRSSEELSAILTSFGIDAAQTEQLFAYTGKETMSITEFLSAASETMGVSDQAPNNDSFALVSQIINDTMNDKKYTPAEMAGLLGPMSDMLNENTVSLMYDIYSSGQTKTNVTMSMEELFGFVLSMSENEKYSDMIDKATKEKLSDAKQALDEGKHKLMGDKHSIMMISSSLPEESDETTDFISRLDDRLSISLSGEYYLVGNSPMQYEMSQSFSSEFNKISIITAAAIFLVILLTFRSVSVPVILIVVIQSAVYATMVIIGILGSGMYYLALLIVQSILMGATVDYGILFTSYYREKRKTLVPSAALAAAYNGSIHTILTSGLIIVIITLILGFAFRDPATGQIVHIISLGAACAILLIIFVLPGVLIALDKITSGIKRKRRA